MLREYVGKRGLRKPEGIFRGQKNPIPNIRIGSTRGRDRYFAVRDAAGRSKKWLAEVIRIRKSMIFEQNSPGKRARRERPILWIRRRTGKSDNVPGFKVGVRRWRSDSGGGR